LGWSHAYRGQYEEAIKSFETGGNWVGLGYVYGKSGRHSEALEKAQYFERQFENQFVDGTWIAHIYVALGDHDKAVKWLDVALKNRSRELLFLRVQKQWEPLRNDPRFEILAAKITPLKE